MQRSSWAFLGAAALILALVVVFYTQPFSSSAPPLTPAEVTRIIERGQRALDQHDSDAIMDLMTPDAHILGRRIDDLKPSLDIALQEIHGRLTITTRRIAVTPDRSAATVTFKLDIGQQTDKMNAVYYPNLGVTLRLIKVREARWLGLASTETWKVSEMATNPVIDLQPL